jgi:hypothetical protein
MTKQELITWLTAEVLAIPATCVIKAYDPELGEDAPITGASYNSALNEITLLTDGDDDF